MTTPISRLTFVAALVVLVLAAPVMGEPPDIPDDIPKGIRAQVEKLVSAERAVRAAGLLRLWSMHDRAAPAAPWIVLLLGDEEPVDLGGRVGKRSCAGIAELILKDIGHPALPSVRSVMGHESARARIRVAGLLDGFEDPRAVDPLLSLAGDPDGDVRRAALLGLVRWRDERVAVVMRKALDSDDPEARRIAIVGVASQKDLPRAELLRGALKDADLSVRLSAITALGNLGAPGLVEALRPFCESGSVEERRSAVSALSNAVPEESLKLLLAAIADADDMVRAAAAHGLGRTRDEAAADPLLAAAKDPSARVREQALRALALIPDQRSTRVLIAGLTDDEVGVRRAALAVLAAPDHPPITDTEALEPLLGMAADRSAMVRVEAIRALAKLALDDPDARVATVIIVATRDGSQSVRTAALRGLALRPEPEALAALLAAAKHRDRVTRRTALEALGVSAEPAACDVLIEAVGDDDGSVRQTALAALGHQRDPRAMEVLIRALEDKRSKSTAIAALGSQDTDRAVEILTKLLNEEKDIFTRAEALRALGGMENPEASDSILAALDAENPNLRSTAIRLVARRKEMRGIPKLIDLLTDRMFGATAEQALKEMTGQDLGRDPERWKEWVRPK